MQAWILSLTVVCGLLTVSWTAPAEDIESLAKLVCETTKGTKRQISHVHQISELVQFYQSLTSEHKLHRCRDLYLESMVELERVVSTGNDDACGEEKIKLIEDFHRKHVSKVSKHVREQKKGNKAPKLAKLFFMQYANQISNKCEQNAAMHLEKNQHPVSSDALDKMNELKKFTDILGMSRFSKGFKGTYIFWNMVDSLDLEKDKKFSKYLGDNDQVRLNVQMKEGRKVRAVQALCQHKLRLLYVKSILPVLRMVDLGYYPHSQQLLSEEPKARSLLLTALVCETIIPMKVYDDEKLNGDQFVALTRDEAGKLAEPEKVGGIVEEDMAPLEVSKVSAADVNNLVSDAETSIESIKENVVSRSNVVGRMLRNAVRQIKERIGQKLSKKLLFVRGPNKKLESVGDNSLDCFDEYTVLQLQEVEEDDEEKLVARRKRGIMSRVGPYLLDRIYAIYLLLLLGLKVVIFAVPMALLFIPIIMGQEWALKTLDFMWRLGLPKEDSYNSTSTNSNSGSDSDSEFDSNYDLDTEPRATTTTQSPVEPNVEHTTTMRTTFV